MHNLYLSFDILFYLISIFQVPFSLLAEELVKLGGEKEVLTRNRKQLFEYTDL